MSTDEVWSHAVTLWLNYCWPSGIMGMCRWHDNWIEESSSSLFKPSDFKFIVGLMCRSSFERVQVPIASLPPRWKWKTLRQAFFPVSPRRLRPQPFKLGQQYIKRKCFGKTGDCKTKHFDPCYWRSIHDHPIVERRFKILKMISPAKCMYVCM